ncbi:GIN domain-containing protein [Asticcacaulis solisilvae]|uniref:GIN domain-containing protein n=1 Tax=Asticcacaulis solisilvae TaxID=1217274 RepID=UPI003FD7B8DC
MRYLVSLSAVSLLALGAATGADAQYRLLSDGPQVEFRDMVARVVVTPEDRSDVDIRVRYGKVKVPTLMVSKRGNVTVLNGHLSASNGGNINLRINLDDVGDDSRGTIFLSGLGAVNVNDLPLVFVRVPMNAIVKDSAYVFGQVGPAKTLDFVLNGSGNWNIAPVNGQLNIIDSGAGHIHAGPVSGDAIIDSMGSGDIALDGTRNLKLSLSGSGAFSVRQAGDVDLQSQGSGDMQLGRIRSLRAGLNGSGDLQVDTVGGNFALVNNGSSDVEIQRLNGTASLEMSGSGDVRISEGQAQTFMIRGSGSGDVDFGGTAGSVNVDSNGSGDVTIGKATGPVQTRVTGSGEMHIGH